MDALPKKTLATARGFTYTYYHVAAQPGRPTLFLLHGFPDSAAEWADLITAHLAPAGYGALAPDMLGYAGTSRPADPAAYAWRGMTADLVAILDAETVPQPVVALGHDWGSRAAQMLYNLHPRRVAGLVTVNVAYTGVPATPMTPAVLDAALAAMQAAHGHGFLWYWKVFCADDGAALLRDHADLLFDVLHAPQAWLRVLCARDGLREVFAARGEGFDLRRRAYATEAMKRDFVARMRRDGFEGPTAWYKSHVFGLQDGQADAGNAVVRVPTLHVGVTEDVLCREETIAAAVDAGLLPRLTRVTLEGPHWALLENPAEFGRLVTGWLAETYGGDKV